MSDTEKKLQDSQTPILELKSLVKKFCKDRDWDQFHGAKDLAIGLITESSELLEIFRFKNETEISEALSDPEKREDISNELADCLFFILRFSERFNFDLSEGLNKKLALSAEKYPVAKFRGSNKKYNE